MGEAVEAPRLSHAARRQTAGGTFDRSALGCLDTDGDGAGMAPEEYLKHDGMALAALIRAGKMSRADVLEAARERIAACNPAINAVIDLYDEPAEDRDPHGPFSGVPFLLKDIGAGLGGKRTSCASRAFADAPPQMLDDELTIRFKGAGFRILGKTNLPELGFNVTSEPAHFGPTRNPFDFSRSAGGSSGGSAAAVASGMVPLAHATDGAGSIRIPAACCGLVGLKPSRGLIPQGPYHADIYGGLVTEGVVSRSVRDSAMALSIMGGADAGAPYAAPSLISQDGKYRIGVLMKGADDFNFDADACRAVSLAADQLSNAGHSVELVPEFLSPDDWRIPRQIYHAQVCAQAAADFSGRDVPDGLEEINRAAILLGRRMPAEQLLAMVRSGQDFARRFAAAIWQFCDVLLMPALASAAPKLGQFPMDHSDVSLHVDRMTLLAPFAGTFNLTGGPALVVRVAQNAEGLPLGVQLASDMGRDLQLRQPETVPPSVSQ
jgi:amidase